MLFSQFNWRVPIDSLFNGLHHQHVSEAYMFSLNRFLCTVPSLFWTIEWTFLHYLHLHWSRGIFPRVTIAYIISVFEVYHNRIDCFYIWLHLLWYHFIYLLIHSTLLQRKMKIYNDDNNNSPVWPSYRCPLADMNILEFKWWIWLRVAFTCRRPTDSTKKNNRRAK